MEKETKTYQGDISGIFPLSFQQELSLKEKLLFHLEEIGKLFPEIPENGDGSIYRKSLIAQELLELRHFFKNL